MTKHRLVVLVAAFAVHSAFGATAPAPAASSPASVDSLSFEIDAQQATVRITTSVPVPRHTCDLESGEVVIRFPRAVSRLNPEYAAPVSYLGAVQVEAPPGGAAGEVVVRISPRATALRHFETRDDGLALQFPAASSTAEAESGEYQVGVGDKLELVVFGHDDLTRTVEVRADGSVNLPLLGDLMVAGKGVSAIADELRDRLGSEFLVDPKVGVEVKEYRSHWVTLMGEVRQPGRFPLRRNMRLLDVLAESGGPTKEAGHQVLLTSQTADDGAPHQQIIAMQELMKAGTGAANPLLHHGDVITVLERDLFYIRGEVNRPSAYVLEAGMTLVKAIAIAGGFTPYASRKEIQILRTGPAGAQERITINLKAIEDGKRDDLPLKADDVIIVSRRVF